MFTCLQFQVQLLPSVELLSLILQTPPKLNVHVANLIVRLQRHTRPILPRTRRLVTNILRGIKPAPPPSKSPLTPSQTNSSRAKTLEIHIAERVAAELEKIQKRETETFEAVREKLTTEDFPSDTQSTTSKIKGAASNALPNNLTPASTTQARDRQAQSSQKVHEEIAKLKRTLSERKVLKDLPPEVEKARSAVVSCLRMNDRRPLDCWREVEAFKSEVKKMEEKFVADVL
jgi:altered-inheritance-of-mitochondria protein 13